MAKASFLTQADALLRKNLTYQKRNKCANITLIVFPILLCVLLATLQGEIDSLTSEIRCGCNKHNENQCGIEYSNKDQVPYCAIPDPTRWPGLLQIPAPDYRAVRTNFTNYSDLPDESCRKNESCPVVTLLTGNNRLLAQSVGMNMLEASPWNSPTLLGSMANNVLGSASLSGDSLDLDTGYFPGSPLYKIQSHCRPNSTWSTEINVLGKALDLEIKCAQGLNLWRNSSSEISDELYKGYWRGNPNNDTNEIVAAYDLLNSNNSHLNVNVWYNATYKNDTGYNWLDLIGLTKVPRSVNLVSNAYLQFLSGTGTRMQFEFIKDTPKPETKNRVDVPSLLGTQFFAYVIIALFPTMLTFLVYENQNRLRIMMKMHGLGDGPYRLIFHIYFLALSSLYMVCFVTFGSIIGLKIFRLNDYGIQFIFYFLYINLQISLAFLAAPLFTNVITARVVGYIFIFGSGLLGSIIFQSFVEDPSFPRVWIVVMELYPGFALYRGLYELGQYSFNAYLMGTPGMGWKNLSDSENGMRDVLILMFLEWLIVLPLAIYLDQVVSSGSGVRKRPLHFLSPCRKSNSKAKRNASEVSVPTEKPDVALERAKVERLLDEGGSLSHSVICDDLSKVYPGHDGNLPKRAVKGVSLAVSRGECFGMLGPNGAGKTSFISMMVGLSEPTSGRAYVEGHDISTQMDEVYTSMGVCPQHDLLWETLTGREHLLFYGRLKNLKGDHLLQAVEESLKSVNLFHGGVGDKFVKKYSGGMKRRLSVAISLIGDPKVVYMDEPGTGLDPASRNNLWNVVKRAKRDRAIILTTHSMEEAEYLCDRLGIFVDGSLQCVANPKELKARYGGSFVLTMTTSSSDEGHVESMVHAISPNAQRVYHISGTQKFELPKQEVRISDVFQAVQNAKSRFTVYAWGLTDTTLEDVFIKVAREA